MQGTWAPRVNSHGSMVPFTITWYLYMEVWSCFWSSWMDVYAGRVSCHRLWWGETDIVHSSSSCRSAAQLDQRCQERLVVAVVCTTHQHMVTVNNRLKFGIEIIHDLSCRPVVSIASGFIQRLFSNLGCCIKPRVMPYWRREIQY